MFRLVNRLPVRNTGSVVRNRARLSGSPIPPPKVPDAAQKASEGFGVMSVLRSPKFQRFIRVGRVIFVSILIYQTGFQNGMVHFAQDPVQVEEEMMKVSLGIESNDKLSDHIHNESSPLHRRVRKVGDRIIYAAREHCNNQLKSVTETLNKIEKEDKQQKILLVELTEQQLMWQQACKRLDGKWSIILSKSPEVNAFVSGMSPRKIFVLEGLINRLQLSDDELAMILGHELSHVILGHIEEQTPVTAMIFGTQLVVMSMVDPLGLGSFFFDIVVARLATYLKASYSRQHEWEADELGLLLTSLACFDIKAGAEVHGKLAELSHHKPTQLNDTHPSSVERKHVLADLAHHHVTDRLTNPMYGQYHRECVDKRQSWHDSLFALNKKKKQQPPPQQPQQQPQQQ